MGHLFKYDTIKWAKSFWIAVYEQISAYFYTSVVYVTSNQIRKLKILYGRGFSKKMT